jgi:hypothetical protein
MRKFLPHRGRGTMRSMVEGAVRASAEAPSTASRFPSPCGGGTNA